jgi:hypothetical protein
MKPVHAITLAVIWITSTVGAIMLKEPRIYWGAAIATLMWLEGPWDKQKED